MRRTSRLVYKTNPEFPTLDVIATAIAVDNKQGFVRSGQGYTKINDDGSEEVIKDNKSVLLHSLLNKEDGIIWKMSGGRQRTEKVLSTWQGKRGGAGRIVPNGFPRPPIFN